MAPNTIGSMHGQRTEQWVFRKLIFLFGEAQRTTYFKYQIHAMVYHKVYNTKLSGVSEFD